MFDPNPITLLGLNHYEYNYIDEQLINKAADDLLTEVKTAPVTVEGKTIDRTIIDEAAELLKSEKERAFYYQLHKYPGLTAFLKGDEQAVIEINSLRLHADQLLDKSAAILSTRALTYVQDAFQKNQVKTLERFQMEVEKGPRSFQEQVFEGANEEIAQRQTAINQIVEDVSSGKLPSSALRGMQLLQQQIPIQALNALPAIFGAERNQIKKTLGKLIHYLGNNDEKDIALALARYTRSIKGEAEYTEKLDRIINQWQRNRTKKATSSKSRDTIMVFSILIIIALVGGGIYYFATSFNTPRPTASITYENRPSINESAVDEEIFDESIYPQLQLPWYERGAAVESSSTGEVKKGSSPMLVCFPAKVMSGEERRVVVIGDPSYDALVFFFNGKDYFEQAFIPAKSQYVIDHALPGKMLSTMIIFGQKWNADTFSPCETKGYFTEKIYYGGFSSYATDPPYLNLATEDVLLLKKSRLMPSRQMEEHEFFELLDKYRN